MSDLSLIARIENRINYLISSLASKNIYTYQLGIARSTLALSTFLTMIFNDPLMLFKNGSILNAERFDGNVFIFQKINFFSLLGVQHLILAKYAAIILLGIVISGYRPRITCIIHFWICISFNYATILIEGGDQIASNLSLMLIPICLLDGRKWHWNVPRNLKKTTIAEINLVSNYFLTVIKLQMCLIYFHAAIGKIPNQEWANGTAIYYWFNDPTFGMNDWMHTFLDPVLFSSFGVAALTWGTLLLELLLFMAIMMNNRAKWILFIMGITFHFGIIIIHGLVSFFFTMAAGLMLYLFIDNKYGKISYFEKFKLKDQRINQHKLCADH